MSDKTVNILRAVIGVPLLTLFSYMLFVMVPVKIYTEAECLRNGYPKYAVSIGLERYCMNLQGTITVRVDKAGQK